MHGKYEKGIAMTSVEATEFAPDLKWFDRTYRVGEQEPVAVFDFDGVLCAQNEDLVYKLEETKSEKPRLFAEARRFGLDPELYDVPYLRHLVLQEALQEQDILPEPGPALRLAKEMSSEGRPFFILTARSGQAAVFRALSFLRNYRLRPQEVFCVGRVAKGRQLRMVREMINERRKVVYFEDSLRHARNSRQQDFVGFEAIHLLWSEPKWDEARKLYRDALGQEFNTGMVNAA